MTSQPTTSPSRLPNKTMCFYGILFGLISITAAIIKWRYPFTQDRQERIRVAIDRGIVRCGQLATGAAE